MDKLMSIAEASAYLQQRGLNLKPSTLRKKIQRKEIPYYAMGRPKLKMADLERYIESKRVKVDRWPSQRRSL